MRGGGLEHNITLPYLHVPQKIGEGGVPESEIGGKGRGAEKFTWVGGEAG